MEFLLSIAGIVMFLAVPAMVLVILLKVCDIQRRLSSAEEKLSKLLARPLQAQKSPDKAAHPATAPEKAAAAPAAAAQAAAKPIELKPPMPQERPQAPEGPRPVPAAPAAKAEPGPLDILFARIRDWLLVTGEFAPSGMSREFAFATRWLVRIGIVMIVASVSYFLKLSIDRGWVGPAQRVMGTVLFGGAASLAGAWTIRKTNYGVVGHALAAIGFAALYLGFGMGHRFFDPPVIASPALAFAALGAVTVFGAVMAVALDSPAISVLSVAGAYLVPVIAGRPSDSPLMLDLYLVMVNLGVFAVARMRRWSVLDFLASMAAYAMCAAWCAKSAHAYTKANVAVNLAFLAVVHFLYFASVFVSAKHRSKPGNAVAWGGLAVNACAFTGWMCNAVGNAYGKEWAGAIMLALTAAYVVLAAVGKNRGWADRQSIGISMFFALAFLAVAPALLVSEPYLAACWSLVAIAAAEGGRRAGMPFLRNLGLAILALAALAGTANCTRFYIDGASCLQAGSSAAQWLKEASSNLLRIGCLPAAFGFLAWRESRADRAGTARKVLVACALASLFVYLTGEADAFRRVFAPGLRGGAVTIVWALYAFALLFAGLSGRTKALRVSGVALLLVAAVKLCLADTGHLAMPWRVGTFALVGVLLMAGAMVYLKFRREFSDDEKKQ